MREGFRILDADRHVVEPIEMWKEYLPREFRSHAPYLGPMLMLDGEPVMQKLSERAQIELAVTSWNRAGELRAASTPDGQLHFMDRSGVDVAFLFPTFAMYLVGNDRVSPELAAAFAHAYNNWLRDLCGKDSERLRGVGLLSQQDPDAMLSELGRIAGFGWRAALLRPNPVAGRTLGDALYEPLWTACERLGVSIAIHEGTHARLPAAGLDRFETRFALHACSHPMEQMMAFLSLLESGVLERHSSIRFAFLEAGCGWLPYWLYRLDDIEYRHLASEVAEHVRVPPSEYFRRQCFVSFEPGEPYLSDVLARHLFGGRPLVFGTDFPHPDHEADIVDQALALRKRVPEKVLIDLLWGNAARLYGLS